MSPISPNSDSNFMLQSLDEDVPVDWAAIFQSVYNGRYIIITCVSVVTFFTFLYAFSLSDIYTSRAQMRVERSKGPAVQYQEMEAMRQSLNKEEVYYATQVQLVKSQKVLEEAVKNLKLPELQNVSIDLAAVRIKGKISVEQVKGTEIIALTVSDTNPQKAADIANAVAEAYVYVTALDQIRIPEQILSWFPNEAEILKDKESLERIRSMSDEAKIEALPTITKDPILNDFRNQIILLEKEKDQLVLKYTPQHPSIIEITKKIDFINGEMEKHKHQLLAALKSALGGEFNVKTANIIERAKAESSPTGPNRVAMVLMSLLGSLALSMSWVIFQHYFHRKIYNADDLKAADGIAFLGYVPEVKKTKNNSVNKDYNIVTEMFLNQIITDSIYDIRNNLMFSMPTNQNKVIMSSSLWPNEGKSSIAVMMAISMANLGEKVLLIDADMRNPSAHKAMGIKNTEGLSNCLSGNKHWKDVVQSISTVLNFSILTAGHKAPNSTALLSSEAMNVLLKDIRSSFDRIIIDVPPLIQIPDALTISDKADGLFLVIRSGLVELKALKQIREKLETFKVHLIGAIINRFNVGSRRSYNEYYDVYGKMNYGNKAGKPAVKTSGTDSSAKN